MALKIMGGEFRSRLLETPRDESTRPMASRAKETIFNLLREWFDDATVLDLFAGVGTMGLEAVSRGAAQVALVERDRTILKILERNVAALGCAERVRIISGDALAAATLATVPRPIDVIFMDPPYAIMETEEGRRRVAEQGARCCELMAEKGWLVLRSPVDPAETDHAIAGFSEPEVHRYGQEMWVMLFWKGKKSD